MHLTGLLAMLFAWCADVYAVARYSMLYLAAAKRHLHPPLGPNAEKFAEYAATIVMHEAVPELQCYYNNCQHAAVALCLDCAVGNIALYAEHDRAMHDWPHAHQRQAVVGFPYKQALRPSHYDPDSGAWQDVRLYHTIGVEVPCSCVGQDPQWDVSDESLQAALPLILITSFCAATLAVSADLD
jgi:hypothetical protein